MSKRDWRNKADYEFTKNLNSNGWAWEFLRRNPEYREDWEKELPIYRQKENEYRTNPQFKDSPVWGKPVIPIDGACGMDLLKDQNAPPAKMLPLPHLEPRSYPPSH